MQISGSASYSALSTIQSGISRTDQAASQIASNGIEKAAQNQSTSQQVARLNSVDRSADLTGDLVELNGGKTQAQLGAKVEKAADQMLGTLIDIHA